MLSRRHGRRGQGCRVVALMADATRSEMTPAPLLWEAITRWYRARYSRAIRPALKRASNCWRQR